MKPWIQPANPSYESTKRKTNYDSLACREDYGDPLEDSIWYEEELLYANGIPPEEDCF